MAMGEAMGVMPTYSVNDNKGESGMGGNWIWIILFILILGGGNGFGGFGGNNNASSQALSNDFLFSNLNHSIDTVGASVNAGFTNVGNGICNLGYENLSNFKDLQAQMSDCCCTTNRNLDSIRYENAKNTCDIIVSGDKNTDRIIAHLNATEMQNLRDNLNSANMQLSQLAQSQNLINQLKPCPVPSYPVCPPYTSPCVGGCI